jgi:hypothetical protein
MSPISCQFVVAVVVKEVDNDCDSQQSVEAM